MRIGIDASRAFGDQKTGTESYSFELITHLLELPEAKKHTWILYTHNSPRLRHPSFKLREETGVSYKEIKLSFLWTQVGLAYQTWIDRLDVLWIPAHTLPILRKPSIKTVVTIHGLEYEWLPAYENWLQRWYLPLSTQYAVGSANRIIAVSKFTRDQLIERLGADSKKINVIYEGINFTEPKRSTKTGERYILFIGTVQPRKNLVRLIEAFCKLKIENCKLVICGKLGWNYQEVLEAAKNKNVEITGFVSNEKRNQLLKGALAYVQPSITEGFGLPVLEAMHAGVPVVSSMGGALAEIVGDAGLLFDPFNVEDIAKKILIIIRNHSLRLVLIKKGHQRIQEFSWEKAARETYKILTNL
ncbi:glycosyltransferase family 4 protein [Candidatus Amesbacteria bacterium]|nr:glycosyltransferase family 4 protein [Candidatus Amesbacteria bacterium]